MTLVLDTSILIDLDRGAVGTARRIAELARLHPGNAKIAFITRFEFVHGLKTVRPRKAESSMAFLNHFQTLHTTDRTADILVKLKQEHDSQGAGLPLADLLIASQAIENGMTLVTKDGDFSRIKGLDAVII